jgi:hypothetical protein
MQERGRVVGVDRSLGFIANFAFAVVVVGSSGLAHGQVCGDPTGDGNFTAADALDVLRTALGLSSCDPCLCDADSSGAIVAADALLVLQSALGGSDDLACPPCVTTTTTTEPPKVACGDPRADAPACDGYCGVNGQMCVESPPGSGACQCIFGATCGGAAGPPICSCGCDALWVCKDIGGICRCVF